MGSKSDRHRPTRKKVSQEVDETETETIEQRIMRFLDEKSEELAQVCCCIRSQRPEVTIILGTLSCQHPSFSVLCPEDERRRATMPEARKSLGAGNQVTVHPLTDEEYCEFIACIDTLGLFQKGYSVFLKCEKQGWDIQDFP